MYKIVNFKFILFIFPPLSQNQVILDLFLLTFGINNKRI